MANKTLFLNVSALFNIFSLLGMRHFVARQNVAPQQDVTFFDDTNGGHMRSHSRTLTDSHTH